MRKCHAKFNIIDCVLEIITAELVSITVEWADPGVLWEKGPKAMRAMRGKTPETVPFQPYFGCTKSFLKVLSN